MYCTLSTYMKSFQIWHGNREAYRYQRGSEIRYYDVRPCRIFLSYSVLQQIRSLAVIQFEYNHQNWIIRAIYPMSGVSYQRHLFSIYLFVSYVFVYEYWIWNTWFYACYMSFDFKKCMTNHTFCESTRCKNATYELHNMYIINYLQRRNAIVEVQNSDSWFQSDCEKCHSQAKYCYV